MASIEDIVNAVSETIKGALGVSLLDLVIQISATIILVFIVKYFLWNKITAFLDKRRKFLEDEIQSAKDGNQLANTFVEKTEKEYLELKNRSKMMLDTAKEKGEQEKAEILAKAKEEASQIFTASLKEFEVEKEKARKHLKDEAIDLAALMAEKIINQKINPKDFQSLSIEKNEGSENK